MADPEERASGLGRPLHELLAAAPDASASVAGMLGDPGAGDLLVAALELLQLVLPRDLVGVCIQVDGDAATTRLAGPVGDADAAWDLADALRAVRRLGRPHLIGPPSSPSYAAPVGRIAAIGARRVDGSFTDAERRLIDLIAAHFR
jgi:hypothetical protein